MDDTPAVWTFRVDTTAPVTVISAIDGKGVKFVRPGAPPSTSATGSTLALGADGSAGLKVACPADAGQPCDGTVGLGHGVRHGARRPRGRRDPVQRGHAHPRDVLGRAGRDRDGPA